MNDAIASIGGEVMTDNSAFLQTDVNGAWRDMQEYLANLGDTRFIGDLLFGPCPITTSQDPAVWNSFSWYGFFDGTSLNTNLVLPVDFISPLKIWERQSGGNYQFPPHPNMENMLDGLIARAKKTANLQWEWREDTIWIPGSNYNMDFRIRYVKNLGDFVNTGTPPTNGTYWYNQIVPVSRCLNPFANFICAAVGGARGDLDADGFLQKAYAGCERVFNRGQRARQRVNIRRQGRSGRIENAGGMYCNTF